MKASLKRIIWALGSIFLGILDTTAVTYLNPDYKLMAQYQFLWLLIVIIPLLFFTDDKLNKTSQNEDNTQEEKE